MNADPQTAERIGLDWLREALAPVGAFGRAYDDATPLYGPGDDAAAGAELRAVLQCAQTVAPRAVDALRIALRAVPEPAAALAALRAGDTPDDVALYELRLFAEAVASLARAWDDAGGDAARRPPGLEALRALFAPAGPPGSFYLADAYDAQLAAAREKLARAETGYDARRAELAARLRELSGLDVPGGEQAVLLRDAFDGPLPEPLRVLRETATYRVVSLEVPAPERDEALAEVAAAEERARRSLAAALVAHAGEVAQATRALGALDRLLARAAFAQRWRGCLPQFGARLAFEELTFAPLAVALQERGRQYTPLSLALEGVAVLTGPNMGGKSAALATAGFACACVALGLPPPARAATLPLLERVAWIGGEHDRGLLLSSYAGEVVRAQAMLAQAGPRSLVLVDEFARTTGPREGRALLIAFAEALRARGAAALVATHFEGVAESAHLPHLRIAGVRAGAFAALAGGDLDAALDTINVAMDYRIVSDAATSASDALALARLLGLEAGVVARAEELYSWGE